MSNTYTLTGNFLVYRCETRCLPSQLMLITSHLDNARRMVQRYKTYYPAATFTIVEKRGNKVEEVDHVL